MCRGGRFGNLETVFEFIYQYVKRKFVEREFKPKEWVKWNSKAKIQIAGGQDVKWNMTATMLTMQALCPSLAVKTRMDFRHPRVSEHKL